MSGRTVIVGILAITCGVAAVISVNRLQTRGAPVANGEAISVVVAAVDLARGTTISEEHLTTRQWPKENVPPGAILSVEECLDRACVTPLYREEPMLEHKLASKESGRGMAALVPAGMRAYTIHTPTASSGVAGFALPGNRVDVLLTVDNAGVSSTTTLLQNLEILAVGQQLEPPNENRVNPTQMQSVTFLVTPDQAAKLTLAQAKGQLHLSLRNAEDFGAAQTSPVTLDDLKYLQVGPLAQSKSDEDEAEKARRRALQLKTSAAVQQAASSLGTMFQQFGQSVRERSAYVEAQPRRLVKAPRIRTLRGRIDSLVLVEPPEDDGR